MEILTYVLIGVMTYYLLGWVTILVVYIFLKTQILLVSNANATKIKETDKPYIFWAWPIILLIMAILWIIYIPYLTLIKFTPRS